MCKSVSTILSGFHTSHYNTPKVIVSKRAYASALSFLAPLLLNRIYYPRCCAGVATRNNSLLQVSYQTDSLYEIQPASGGSIQRRNRGRYGSCHNKMKGSWILHSFIFATPRKKRLTWKPSCVSSKRVKLKLRIESRCISTGAERAHADQMLPARHDTKPQANVKVEEGNN